MENVVDRIAQLLDAFPFLRTFGSALALLAFTLLVVVALEAIAHADLSRYRSREFRTDFLYALVYQGGIYHIVLLAPVLALVAIAIPSSWNLGLLSGLPPLAGFLVYWVLSDAIGYWLHRLQHHAPLLWRLHSIHHSQTRLTFATSYRNHLVEQLYVNLAMYVPLMLLGSPKWYWLPAMLAQNVYEALQHADLKWRYGPLYPVFVSPVFHAIHHSPERTRHDSNYGKLLAIWDWMFGTISRGERPKAYGVAGLEAPVSFWATCIAPFSSRWGREPAKPAAAARSAGVATDG
jgi:sterol desaturase/sphingolipid hydroxylase (fatty acid hydroxylase superfamily)